MTEKTLPVFVNNEWHSSQFITYVIFEVTKINNFEPEIWSVSLFSFLRIMMTIPITGTLNNAPKCSRNELRIQNKKVATGTYDLFAHNNVQKWRIISVQKGRMWQIRPFCTEIFLYQILMSKVVCTTYDLTALTACTYDLSACNFFSLFHIRPFEIFKY